MQLILVSKKQLQNFWAMPKHMYLTKFQFVYF